KGIRDSSVTGVQTCALPISLEIPTTQCLLLTLFASFLSGTHTHTHTHTHTLPPNRKWPPVCEQARLSLFSLLVPFTLLCPSTPSSSSSFLLLSLRCRERRRRGRKSRRRARERLKHNCIL